MATYLEGNDDKTYENVDHEEGNDNQVDKVEEEDALPVVLLGAHVSLVRVDGNVQDTEIQKSLYKSNSMSVNV